MAVSRRAIWPRAASKSTLSVASVTESSTDVVQLVCARATALTSALDSGAGCLPAGGVDLARAAISKTARRTSFAGGRTVVAFAGATGSGKSSLFNVLAGTDFALVGVRRPTTSMPAAAIWGSESPSALLDWLMVGSRLQVGESESNRPVPDSSQAHRPPTTADTPETPADRAVIQLDLAPTALPGIELDGLVLLDLPDFDSRANAHRVEADRVLDLVDVFIWVTDPQKYADSRLHDEYIARLSAHDAVTITVLNQADRLTPVALADCTADLQRLLESDGVVGPEVIAVSAKDGLGIGDLRARINTIVKRRNAAVDRLDSDLRSAAIMLRGSVAESEPSLTDFNDAGLVEALSRAAGIPVLLDAVERDFWGETRVRTGWPPARLLRALRLRLRRLAGLNRDESSRAGARSLSQPDAPSATGPSSSPAATPAARAAVAVATRDLGARFGRELPLPWADAVNEVAMPPAEELGAALDQAVGGTSVGGRDPFWWRAFGVVQWILLMTATVGLSWLVVLTVLDRLRPQPFKTPGLGPLPYPILLLVGGLLIGYLISLMTGAFGRVGGKRRRVLVAARLQDCVADVVRDRLVVPVQEVFDRHRMTREHLETALTPAQRS